MFTAAAALLAFVTSPFVVVGSSDPLVDKLPDRTTRLWVFGGAGGCFLFYVASIACYSVFVDNIDLPGACFVVDFGIGFAGVIAVSLAAAACTARALKNSSSSRIVPLIGVAVGIVLSLTFAAMTVSSCAPLAMAASSALSLSTQNAPCVADNATLPLYCRGTSFADCSLDCGGATKQYLNEQHPDYSYVLRTAVTCARCVLSSCFISFGHWTSWTGTSLTTPTWTRPTWILLRANSRITSADSGTTTRQRMEKRSVRVRCSHQNHEQQQYYVCV